MDAFWIMGRDARFLEVNDAFCRLIGYSREELLGMSVLDIEALETPEETAERIRQVARVGAARFETRHRRKDGSIRFVEISTNYLPKDGGLHSFRAGHHRTEAGQRPY
jgi:PAS domain S-box-containing protein